MGKFLPNGIVAGRCERSREVERDRDRIEDMRPWCRDHHVDWGHDRRWVERHKSRWL